MYGRSLKTSSSQRGAVGRRRAHRWVGAITAVALWSPVAPALILAPVAGAVEAPVTLLVQLEPGLSESEQALVIAEQGAVEAAVIAPLALHEVTVDAADLDATLAGFAADTSVVSASVDLSRQAAGSASDPEYAGQWAMPLIGWEDVHGVATLSGAVTLAVLDTGVDASAPDLAGRVGAGWSFDGSDPASDPNGHGTHTATIAAASADDGVGIAGVAYSNTTIMPVKVLDSAGTGSDSDVIAGLVWAADHGAGVVVMPFSNPGYSAALQAAIDYVWASGAVLVAAAGNDGSSTPSYPAGDAKVVGVGATALDDAPWEASNKSDAVFVHAPGVDVLASDATGTVSVTGTSASAALTAGAAAALRSIDPTASNETIIGRLARNADPLNDNYLGNGRINVGRASIDTATDGVTPTGAPSGGPFVGPYIVATARTWTGVGSTNYNNGGNWTPAGTPTALDALTIPGAVPSGRYPYLNAGTGGGLAASIVVGSGGSLQVTGVPLTVSGLLTNNTGGSLIVSGGGTISVLNNVRNDGNLALSGPSTIAIPQDYFGSGVATMSAGTITVGRNWRPAGGSFTATGGKVEFNGFGDINANFAAATSQFYDVVVAAGADPRFAQAAGSSIKIAHDFTNASTALTMGPNATFTFNGSVNQTVSSAATGATFGHIVVDKPSGVVSLATNALVSGNATVTDGTLSLGAFGLGRTTAGGTISVADGALLRIGGTGGFPANYTTRSLAPASTVSYDGSSQTVSGLPYGNLTLDTSGPKTMPASPLTVAGDFAVRTAASATAASAITVAGDALFGPGTSFNAGSFTHRVGGNFTNHSTAFNAGTSTFVLDGTSPQTIGGLEATPFNNLKIDNPSGVLLARDVVIGGGGTGGLVFTNGNITTGANTVIMTATGAVNRTSGHVVGKLRKQISTNGTVLRSYEVGTATSYAPVDITLNGVTGAGVSGFQFLTVNANAGDHPNLAASGIDSGQSTNLSWTLATSGTWSFSTYDATLGFTSADVDAGADPSVFIVRRNNGGTWFAQPVGTRTPTSTHSVGHTTFGDLAVGEPSGDATGTGLSCPASVGYGLSGSCVATVTTAIPGVAPSGTVTFTTDGSGAFTPSSSCTLVPLTTSSSTCSVTYSPTEVGTGTHQIGASFSDGIDYAASAASPADITVTPAALTITADDQTKVYGTFDPVFTFTYAGLTNGDVGPASAPTCTVAVSHDDVAGSPYPITCSGAVDPNYAIAYTDGELSVTPAPLTVTADDQTRSYGAADPAFTFTYGGLTNGDTGSATPPTCEVTGVHEEANGSPYPITCSGAVDPNYSISYVDGALTVTPVALSVTADDQTKVYGDFDPSFTFAYAGLTNGDAGPETAPACTVVGPHEDVVGSPYPISCSGAVDPNYSITYVSGVLTVTHAPLTITADDQTKAYGAFDPVFAFTYSGLTYGDTETDTPPTCSVAGPHDDVAASPYSITCSGAVDPNYSITYVEGELSVTPAPLSITADNQTKVAGDPDPPFTFTYIGLTNGDTGTGTPSTCTVVGPHDTVGGSPYPITCSGAVDPNYSITYVDGILTVTPATVAPTVVSIDRADPDPTSAALVEWTVSFSSAVSGVGVDDFSLAGTGTAGASVVAVSADSGSTRTVTVVTGAPGTLALHLDDDDSIVDTGPTALGGTGTGTVGSGGAGNGSFAGQSYTIDPAPTATVTAPAGMEGIAAPVTGTMSDDDPLTFAWSFTVVSPEGATCTEVGTDTLTPTVTCDDDAQVTAALSVDDGVTVTTAEAVLIIENVAPDAGELMIPVDPLLLGSAATVSATFGDVGANDTHTVTVDWGDGAFTGPGATTSPISAIHTYAVPGVYSVTATVIDDDTGSDVSVTDGYVVVYDPTSGHVTGGGKLSSPVGSYLPDPTLAGTAQFGFNARYKRGAIVPSGNTEFTLIVCQETGGGDHDGDNDDEHDCGRDRDGRDGDDRRDRHRGDDHDDDDGRGGCVARGFTFKSTSYEWLAVPGSTEATYQGVGRLNGVSGYAFTVTVQDGGRGQGVDRMRMQIWNPAGDLVYDNQMGAPYEAPATQLIASGQIQIHRT